MKKSNIGCILGGIGVLVVAILGGFWLHSATITRRVDPGHYGVVISYHNDGGKDIAVYDGGTQYYVEWGSNVRDFEYSSSVQTIKIYRSKAEGIAPWDDEIFCQDTNGVRFSGDLQAHFSVLKGDVSTVYSQHPNMDLSGSVDDSIAGVVVRPILQAAWQSACASRTYTTFMKDKYGAVSQDMMHYAAPLLKAQGVTLIDVIPQTVYLPDTLQASLDSIAKANADLEASQVAIQTAKNQASALEELQKEIAKNPALLKLVIIEKILEHWNGQGVLPSYLTNP